MSTTFNHEKVFLHWSLMEKKVRIREELGLVVLRDDLTMTQEGLSLEQRFKQSGADLALVDTFSFVFEGSDDLLQSKLLRARAVCVKSVVHGERAANFNEQLDALGFLSIWINDLRDQSRLASLFVRALQNVKVGS